MFPMKVSLWPQSIISVLFNNSSNFRPFANTSEKKTKTLFIDQAGLDIDISQENTKKFYMKKKHK